MDQIPTILSEFHWASNKLEKVRESVDRITERLTLLHQRNLLKQQQAQQAMARIDKLLSGLKQVDHYSIKKIGQRIDSDEFADPSGQRLRSEILRRSAHDLKSNFGIVQGAIYMLSQAQTDLQRQDMITMLQRNVEQATQLASELLDMTRLETGQEYRQLTMFNVADLLSDLVETVRPLADKRGLWLRQEGADFLLIEGDSMKIFRIAQNLILNAINYTQGGGITLDWDNQVDSHNWQLRITDTGPGLRKGNHHSSGEGVGLLIVEQLCSLLEGELMIEKLEESGTRFVLSFPQRYPHK